MAPYNLPVSTVVLPSPGQYGGGGAAPTTPEWIGWTPPEAPAWSYTPNIPAWGYSLDIPEWSYTPNIPQWSYTPTFEDPNLAAIDYTRPDFDWSQYGQAAQDKIRRQAAAQAASATAGLRARGMAGTTIAPSMTAGIALQGEWAAQEEADKVAAMRLGYESDWRNQENTWRLGENQLAANMAMTQWGLQNQAALAEQAYGLDAASLTQAAELAHMQYLMQGAQLDAQVGIAEQQYGLSAAEIRQAAELARQQYLLNAWATSGGWGLQQNLAHNQWNLGLFGQQSQNATSANQLAWQYYNTGMNYLTEQQRLNQQQNLAYAQMGGGGGGGSSGVPQYHTYGTNSYGDPYIGLNTSYTPGYHNYTSGNGYINYGLNQRNPWQYV